MMYCSFLLLLGTLVSASKGRNETHVQPVMKIVGGTEVSEAVFQSTYPTLAQPAASRTGASFCTATVIGRRHILWAAHCVHSALRNVRIGRARDGAATQTLNVVRQISHPSYNTRTMFADIALIEVDADIQAPIAAVAGFNFFNTLNYGGQQAWAAGWGWLAENIPPPGVLHHVQIGIDRTCSFTGDICTTGNPMSSPAGWRTCTCYGDSGGPLLFQGVVLGVVSRGPAPCELGITYYASTEFFGTWLQSIVTNTDGEAGINGTITYPRPLRNKTLTENVDCLTEAEKGYIASMMPVLFGDEGAASATKQALVNATVDADSELSILIHHVIQELLIDDQVLDENVAALLTDRCPVCADIQHEFQLAINTISDFMNDTVDANWAEDPVWRSVNGLLNLLRTTSQVVCDA